MASGNAVHYLLYDGHGSTRGVINGAGAASVAVLQRYTYDAYGNMLSGTGLTSTAAAALTSLLYSGEKTDATGLQYLRSRYYDPASGRFTTFDSFNGNPSDPQSLHKYLYVQANPILFNDPTGHFESLVGFSVASSFASIVSQMNVVVGQSIIDSLGVQGSLDAFSQVTSWAWSKLPQSVQDAIETAIDIVFSQDAAALAGEAYLAVGVVVGARQLTLFDKFRRAENDIANAISDTATVSFHGHHPLPKFLGGVEDQVLSNLPQPVHIEFHRLLEENLKRAGFDLPVGGRGGGYADWRRFFEQDPGRQRVAFDAVFDASRFIDEKHGTNITQAVWRNIIEGNFQHFP